MALSVLKRGSGSVTALVVSILFVSDVLFYFCELEDKHAYFTMLSAQYSSQMNGLMFLLWHPAPLVSTK